MNKEELNGMKCVKCGADNAAGAKFCKNCGAHLEGVCAKCGSPLEKDSKFCPSCGKRVKTAKCCCATNAFKFAADACALFSALVSVIFVFFIGLTVSIPASAIDGVSGADLPPNLSIFYAFGDTYYGFNNATEWSAALTILPSLFGTIVSAMTIAGVGVLFVMTLTRFIRQLLGKEAKSVFLPAAGAFFTFIFGVALFSYIFSVKVSISGIVVGMVLNEATVAGLVLGGIGIVANLLLTAASGGKDTLKAKGIFRLTSSAVVIILFSVLFAFLTMGISMAVGGMGSTYGFSSAFEMLSSLGEDFTDSNFATMFYTDFAAGILAAIAIVVACALLVKAAVGYLGGTPDANTRKAAIFAGICAAFAGIMKVVATTVFTQWYTISAGEYGSTIIPNITAALVLIILGVITIAVAGVHKKLEIKYCGENEAAAVESADEAEAKSAEIAADAKTETVETTTDTEAEE